jgi:hypothetical protein
VVFNYTGYNESGGVIDSSYRQGRPAQTRVGINGMIPGARASAHPRACRLVATGVAGDACNQRNTASHHTVKTGAAQHRLTPAPLGGRPLSTPWGL